MNALQKDLKRLTALAEMADLPHDAWRLDFHLMPPVGWLNDPNGLCWFQGYYHVFFQYAPFHAEGGVKFWGHYRSTDLLRWEQCPVMLFSDQPFDVHGAYSGSALCENNGMYLFYTGNVKYMGDYDYIRTGRGHNTVLAFSPDGISLSWKRLLMDNQDYPEGLSCHVRDPKVWKQDGSYYMIQGARTLEDTGVLLVFESQDLLDWKHINTIQTPEPFGYMWECPDLFELDGHWFLAVSPQGAPKSGPGFENIYACGYFPLEGDFRGNVRLGEFIPLDYGFDFYAPQTFTHEGRRLMIGWLGMPDADYTNPTAAYGWQHCLTIPREIRYDKGKLCQCPAKELTGLRTDAQNYQLDGETQFTLGQTAEIIAEGQLAGLTLPGLALRLENGQLRLEITEGGHGRTVRTAPADQLEALHILMDTSAVEIFINHGRLVMSTRWYPAKGPRPCVVYGQGTVSVHRLRAFEVSRPV